MSNSDLMRDYFKNTEYTFNEGIDDYGCVFFCSHPIVLDAGNNITLVFQFGKDEKVLDIKIFNIATIESPLKREELLKLTNELNITYRFGKFVVNSQGDIVMEETIAAFEDFNPKEVVEVGYIMARSVNESYEKFMKLRWL